MVRLGCVTAMALDGGGSTTMAFEGKVLNLPSDGAERPIGNALAFLYTGVYVAEIPAVLSPDGDGVDDAAGLRLKLVRPSATVVSLTAPDGTVAFTETLDRLPGAYAIPFPPERQGSPVREGSWTFAAQATDDAGRATSMSRTFRVDTTLGFLRARTPVYVPPRGRDHRILFRLTRSARVQLTVETPGGTVVRTLARRRYEPGRIELTWNGLGRNRKPLKGGLYVVRAVATSTQGTVEQRRKIRVLRVAGPKATAR
jgi:Phosphodiester glycosidase/FlgD Ig-like domain